MRDLCTPGSLGAAARLARHVALVLALSGLAGCTTDDTADNFLPDGAVSISPDAADTIALPDSSPDGAHADADGQPGDGEPLDTVDADTTGPDALDAAADALDAAADSDADSDADADAGPCEPPECGDSERVVGCECVSVMDRKCLTDEDCREDETCVEVEGLSVCWWEPPPVRVCPGSEGCTGVSEDTQLYAGAASMVVTPDGFETPYPAGLHDDNGINFGPEVDPEKWRDCGYDDVCPGEEGYPGPDEGEGDGIMQGAWLAGFSSGRPAQRCSEDMIGCDEVDCCVSSWAHDDILLQIAVIRQADVTVAFAALDSVGFFHTDIDRIRKSLPAELGVDLLVMGATHNHESPDTAGQWGPGNPVPFQSGRDAKFFDKIRSQALAGIQQAIDNLEPVEAEVAVVDLNITHAAMTDSRAPYIIDNNAPVVRFVTMDPEPETVATLLSIGNHAEVLWANNPYITADYPHFVRKYVTEGMPAKINEEFGVVIKPALPGFGGVTVFFAGAVGGLVNPGKGTAVDYHDNVYEEHSFRMADAVGQGMAKQILLAHQSGNVFTKLEAPTLRFATKRFLVSVRNSLFQLAAFVAGLIPRDVYNTTQVGFLDFGPDLPKLQSQTAVIQLGPLSFFTGPGEAFPETLCGGFPDKPTTQTPVVGDIQEHRVPAICGENHLPMPEGEAPGTHPCIVKPDQVNPPDWDAAPEPPYGYDWVAGEHKFYIGLGMDFLGYVVPEYDYEEDGYFDKAPGDHYEETNGIGPEIIVDWRTALEICNDALGALDAQE